VSPYKKMKKKRVLKMWGNVKEMVTSRQSQAIKFSL